MRSLCPLGVTEPFENIMKTVSDSPPDRCHIPYKFSVVVSGPQGKSMETLQGPL